MALFAAQRRALHSTRGSRTGATSLLPTFFPLVQAALSVSLLDTMHYSGSFQDLTNDAAPST